MAEFHGRNSFQVLFAMNHSREFLPILCVAYKNRVVSGPSCNDHIFLAKISCVFEHFSCFFRKHFIHVDGRSVVCEQFLRGQNSYFVKLSIELDKYSGHWVGFSDMVGFRDRCCWNVNAFFTEEREMPLLKWYDEATDRWCLHPEHWGSK